jgi:hypothetical protein
LWEREGADEVGGRVRGTLRVRGDSPSSFRRFAPPSFSHKGRRNLRILR